MEALFFGICTHLQNSVRNEPHRVALPASDGYSVPHPLGGTPPLTIPNHTPQLAIRTDDIWAGDLHLFAGKDLHPLTSSVAGELCWTLDKVIFDFAGLETLLSRDLHCLPHIGLPGIELQTGIANGNDFSSVAAFIDVRNGALSVVRDSADSATLEGRHVLLEARQVNPWSLQVRTLSGQPRVLQMKADARVTFSNTAINPEQPCDQNDYLLNFRLTTLPFVTATDFRLPSNCPDPASPIEMRAFPSLSRVPYSTTLSDCSNTVYP